MALFKDDARIKELTDLVIAGTATDEQFEELGGLRKAKQKAVKDRDAAIAQTKDSVKNLEITIYELFSNPEIEEAAASLKPNFGKSRKSAEASTGGTRSKNELHPFGMLPFKDFGFTPPTGVKEAGLDWVHGKVYGPTWPTEYLKKVREVVMSKGIATMDKYMSPEFKAWLDEGVQGQGPAKGRMIYANRKKFNSFFGMKADGTPDPKSKYAVAPTAAKKTAKA